MLDLVQRVLGLRGVRFRRYGTLGQKQHGIDLAGSDPNGAFVVVQCKDYKSFTKADLRKAVATFVSGRRPFGAAHLIVVTSATTEPTPEHTTFGSGIVTDAYLAGLLDEPIRTACLEKLLNIAEDASEAARNRQNALEAAANLALEARPEVRENVFRRSKSFVTGEQDGSAYDDEVTGPPTHQSRSSRRRPTATDTVVALGYSR